MRRSAGYVGFVDSAATDLYAALTARDPRFDGRFFVGVTTTGVYCRPICPARTPRRERCTFHSTAAEAEKAGFRACFRCRPELAPGLANVDARSRLTLAATRQIEEGFLNEASVDDLATKLGVTARHLDRTMQRELGVSPVELAQSRRLALAKQLLQDTKLSLTDVAFASGFGSVRRFNSLFAERFGRPPTDVRRRHGGEASEHTLTLRLDFRPPFAWEALLQFLKDRAIPGVERVTDDSYVRSVRLDDSRGIIVVRRDSKRDSVVVEVSHGLARHAMYIARRVRALFDLDADPAAVALVLRREPLFLKAISQRPGLRVPGTIDPFEAAVRAILGQQVTVRGATTLAGRLVQRFGVPLADATHEGVSHEFPKISALAEASVASIAELGMPGRRAESLRAVARFAAEPGSLLLDPLASPKALREALVALPGLGPWTAEYVTMRALHDPDAFVASDLGVKKALNGKGPKEAEQWSEHLRPYRAYAVMHLWRSLSETKPVEALKKGVVQ